MKRRVRVGALKLNLASLYLFGFLATIFSPLMIAEMDLDGDDNYPQRGSWFDVIGEAYDIETQQWRYRELHLKPHEDDDGIVHKRILYQDSSGSIFAEKSLRYASAQPNDVLRPELTQSNHRTGRSLSVEIDQSGGSDTDLSWLVRLKFQSSESMKTSRLSAEPEGVIDAGFDAWIALHWKSLRSEKMVSFLFLAPTRSRWVRLQARQSSCVDLPIKSVESESLVCLVVEPKNPVLRWLLDPIELAYQELDQEKPRLVFFRGLANLTDDEGQGIRVDIRYRYNTRNTFVTH